MRYTDAPRRREQVLERLGDAGYVSSATLAETLAVSEMTIRRDLQLLAAAGLVRRVTGGAALPGGVGARPFEERTAEHHPHKLAIARAAAALVAPGASVALDAGTTVVGVASLLPPGTTVASHSLPVLDACGERDDVTILGLGGSYQPATRSFAGPGTRAAIEPLALDLALLSAVGVSADGASCTTPFDAETKQLLARAASRVAVLADADKLGRRAQLRFLTLDRIDVLVTDETADDAVLRMLRDAIPEVIVVPVPT